MTNDLITIISPLYNKVNYIDQTINSVINQTSSAWELIIVDDGSTDGSYEVVEKYLYDSRIKLFRRSEIVNSSRGANICRNIGANEAKGDFLLFLDADDLLTKNCIKDRLYSIQNIEEVSDLYIFNVAYCKGEPPVAYEKIKPSKVELDYVNKFSDELENYFLPAFLSFDLLWHTSGAIWKRSFFNEIGGFDLAFDRLQDPEIHTKALLLKPKISYLKNVTHYDVLHRKDDDRVVWDEDTFVKKQLNSFIQYITKFYDILILDPINKKYLKFLSGYVLEIEKLLYRYERDSDNDLLKKSLKKEISEFYKTPIFINLSSWHLKSLIGINNVLNIGLINKLKLRGAIFKIYKKYFLNKYGI